MRTTETELVDMSKNAASGFMPSMSRLAERHRLDIGAPAAGNTTSACSPTAFGCRPRRRWPDRARRRAADVVDDELVPAFCRLAAMPAHHAEPGKTDLHTRSPIRHCERAMQSRSPRTQFRSCSGFAVPKLITTRRSPSQRAIRCARRRDAWHRSWRHPADRRRRGSSRRAIRKSTAIAVIGLAERRSRRRA